MFICLKIMIHSIIITFQDFFMAGTHTSASAIEWSLAKLINHPTVLEKARMEMDKVVGNNRLVEESNYRLPYIQAIIKETLRLHPPIPLISRKSMKECNINERMLGPLEGTPSLGKIQWNSSLRVILTIQ